MKHKSSLKSGHSSVVVQNVTCSWNQVRLQTNSVHLKQQCRILIFVFCGHTLSKCLAHTSCESCFDRVPTDDIKFIMNSFQRSNKPHSFYQFYLRLKEIHYMVFCVKMPFLKWFLLRKTLIKRLCKTSALK